MLQGRCAYTNILKRLGWGRREGRLNLGAVDSDEHTEN